MNKKAVALLSGGLDSTLAVCLVKEQGIEIEAVNFQTMFGCCKDDARRAAARLGVGFTLLKVGEDYLRTIERPKYGYGRGMNACVDCRIYMFHLAKRLMENVGASFLISGEVLGQRPMSQKMRDFRAIEKDCGLEGKIVRPLSAKLLPVTEPERAGILDRAKFFGVQGRSRQLLLELAAKYGIDNPPSPSAGCALASPEFAKKVKDIFDHHPAYERWEFEILKIGRHFRLSPQSKLIVARNHDQNEYLERLHPNQTALLSCENFGGPHALLVGNRGAEILEKAGRIILRYAQKPLPAVCRIQIREGEAARWIEVSGEASQVMLDEARIV